MKKVLTLTALLPAIFLAGCLTRTVPGNSSTNPAAVSLAASLISPVDIRLKWRDPTSGAAGHTVEYATEPKGEYVILGFLPPGEDTFVHSNLMPETTFYYRVQPYYGPTSGTVEVRLPDSLSDAEYAARYEKPEDFSWAAPVTNPEATDPAAKSLRSADPAAGPTDLKASLVPPTVSGFKLTWTDHARDGDGYLLETRPDEQSTFHVCAATAPKINSFGWAFDPPQRRGFFRVRAYYCGPPSNVASQTTGKAP